MFKSRIAQLSASLTLFGSAAPQRYLWTVRLFS
jgi:hypothetical protein